MNQNYKIVITTQFLENYGDAERPYWKCKGGSDYVVLSNEPQPQDDFSEALLTDAACAAIEELLPNNDMCHEYVLGTNLASITKPSNSEESQMEFDGAVSFYEDLFVLTRDFSTGERSFRKANADEVAAYRAQLHFPTTEEA